jgi:hypothetical protein
MSEQYPSSSEPTPTEQAAKRDPNRPALVQELIYLHDTTDQIREAAVPGAPNTEAFRGYRTTYNDSDDKVVIMVYPEREKALMPVIEISRDEEQHWVLGWYWNLPDSNENRRTISIVAQNVAGRQEKIRTDAQGFALSGPDAVVESMEDKTPMSYAVFKEWKAQLDKLLAVRQAK